MTKRQERGKLDASKARAAISLKCLRSRNSADFIGDYLVDGFKSKNGFSLFFDEIYANRYSWIFSWFQSQRKRRSFLKMALILDGHFIMMG